MRYDYRFDVWPDENRRFATELFDVFRLLNRRVEMTFTEADFKIFRMRLASYGFTLRGVVRVPHQDPEPIL